MIVTTTLAAWLDDGPRLVTMHPEITTVRLTDREPSVNHRNDYPDGVLWVWARGFGPPAPDWPHLLPLEIFVPLAQVKGLPRGMYPNDYTAISALSAALLVWARGESLLRGLRKTPPDCVVFEEAVLP